MTRARCSRRSRPGAERKSGFPSRERWMTKALSYRSRVDWAIFPTNRAPRPARLPGVPGSPPACISRKADDMGCKRFRVIVFNHNAIASRFHDFGHAADASGYERSTIRQRLDRLIPKDSLRDGLSEALLRHIARPFFVGQGANEAQSGIIAQRGIVGTGVCATVVVEASEIADFAVRTQVNQELTRKRCRWGRRSRGGTSGQAAITVCQASISV